MTQMTIDGIPKPPRPNDEDAFVRAAAKSMAEKMGDSSEDAIQDILDAQDIDAYKFARNLDNYGWSITEDDVEKLRCFSELVEFARIDAWKQWVKDWDIKPCLEVGQEVMLDGLKGYVAAIRNETAQYTIRVPALGHSETGPGVVGRIVKYEQVEGDQ